jgi:hypothetical protein
MGRNVENIKKTECARALFYTGAWVDVKSVPRLKN